MAPLVQLDLREAPFVPEALAGIALLAVFLSTDGETWAIPGTANGASWLVRAHATVADLVAIETPRDAQFLRPRALVWERVDDYPGYEDLVDLVDADALERLVADCEPEDAVGETVSGTKIGGWPSLIQAELTWPGSGNAVFAFQVDSDASVGLNLWDGGVLHVGRTAERDWIAEAQFL